MKTSFFFSANTLIQHSKLKNPKSPGTKILKCLGINKTKPTKIDIPSNIGKSQR